MTKIFKTKIDSKTTFLKIPSALDFQFHLNSLQKYLSKLKQKKKRIILLLCALISISSVTPYNLEAWVQKIFSETNPLRAIFLFQVVFVKGSRRVLLCVL